MGNAANRRHPRYLSAGDVQMKANSLLRLYPRKWQERYGAEVAALTEEAGLSGLAAFDLLLGAGREWARVLTRRDVDRSANLDMNCPSCKTSIGFEAWIQMKARSGSFNGRLIRECASCGTLIRLTQAWSIARTLSSLLLLFFIFTDIPGAHQSRTFTLGKITTSVILLAALQFAARSVRLEIVPLDYGGPH